MSDVSDVLRDRMQEPGGFERMATLSVVGHGAVVALVLLAPGGWWHHAAQPPPTVMTISLGGGVPGPQSGGMTPMGGRPVQEVRPADAPPRPEAIRPPAAKTPEMTMPAPNAKPTKAAAATVTQAPDDAKGRTPTRGAQTRAGSTTAETGVRGQGFGLSTGGGAGSGSYLDVANFCCPAYIEMMTERIRANWNPQSDFNGETVVKFTIQRSGAITDVSVEKSSGFAALDFTAQRAVHFTAKQLNPLPPEFTNPTLTVHLSFQYQR